MGDEWHSQHHEAEAQDELMPMLFHVSQQLGAQVTILTGDVHVAFRGVAHGRNLYQGLEIQQICSSAMASEPPPNAVVGSYNAHVVTSKHKARLFESKVTTWDEVDFNGRPYAIWKKTPQFISEHNFATLEAKEDGSLRACLITRPKPPSFMFVDQHTLKADRLPARYYICKIPAPPHPLQPKIMRLPHQGQQSGSTHAVAGPVPDRTTPQEETQSDAAYERSTTTKQDLSYGGPDYVDAPPRQPVPPPPPGMLGRASPTRRTGFQSQHKRTKPSSAFV